MRAASALVLLALAAASASAASGVHLTWLGDAYGVTFHTPSDASPVVHWRGDGSGSVPAARVRDVDGPGNRSFLARLPPGTTHYELDALAVDLRPPPGGDDAVRVAFFADSGRSDDAWEVMEAVRAADPGLVLVGGDLHYADGREGLLEEWLARVEPLASRAPLMTVPGDHERLCTEGVAKIPCERELASYREHFVMPGGELFWDLDWGPLHVVGLDAEAYQHDVPRELKANATEQEGFLRASLAERPDAWNVVLFHRTMYTTGAHHGPDEAARARIVPVLEEEGADLVLMGNEHLYERTWPLKGGVPAARADETRAGDGVVYVTSGGGGRELYDEWGPVEPWSAVRAAEREFLVLDATEHLLRVTAVRPDGSVLDAFSVAKDLVGAVQQDLPVFRPPTPDTPRPSPAPLGLAAVAVALLLRRQPTR